MKTSVLLFLAGIALGVAGMLVFQPSPKDRSLNPVENGGPAAGASSNRVSTLTRATRKGRKDHKRALDSRDVRETLEELLATFNALDDESQLDVMQLIRQASLLTQLNESEAIDLLFHFAEPKLDAEMHNRAELNGIVSIIVFARLCEINGPEAMRMAASGQLIEDFDEEAIAVGMNSWVAADPEGAQRWYEGIMSDADAIVLKGDSEAAPPEMLKLIDNDELRQAYFNGMVKQDPEGLEESINQYESEDVRNAMREDLMTSLVAQEDKPEGLLEILNKSTDLDDARVSAVEKLSELDPHQAASWVESQLASSAHDHEITTVAAKLMEQDSDAGITWYLEQQMHDTDRENDRVSRIVHHLARDDVSKASRWVEQQPDNASRDYAEVSMASTFANQRDWDNSMSWISGVEASSLRNNTLNQILQRGWDKREGQLQPEVLSAAEAAGFGEAARAYQPK